MSFTLENDFFAGQDRHYTNGLQVASLVDLRELPEALRKSAPFAWSTDPQFVFAVGQRIFTPADLERAIPDRRDRPYAGWLYFMTELRVRSGSVVDHLLVNMSGIGRRWGRVQNCFVNSRHLKRYPSVKDPNFPLEFTKESKINTGASST